jgi:hypothetical protein
VKIRDNLAALDLLLDTAASVEPAWLEFSTGARQMLSKAYAEYLACDSVIEPVYLDAAGRVVATAKATSIWGTSPSAVTPTARSGST